MNDMESGTLMNSIKWDNLIAVVIAVSMGCLSSRFFNWLFTSSRVLRQGRVLFPTVEGKHVVVTGGSSGIGYSIAEEALKEGAQVTLIARNLDKLQNAKQSLIQDYKGLFSPVVHVKAADVSDSIAIGDVIREAHERRPIDILVCNAGIITPGHFDEVSTKELKDIVETNVLGSMYPIHATIPLMKQHGSGSTPRSIVLISSAAGLFYFYGANIYAATKYAQRGMAEVLRWELLPYNIHVHIVCPGFVDTPMTKSVEVPTKVRQIAAKMNLINELITPDHVAKCTLEGLKEGIFLITTDWLGHYSAVLSRGPIPGDDFATNLWELSLAIPLRLISYGLKTSMIKTILRLVNKGSEEP